LTDNIALDPAPWQELYDSDEPHKVLLPGLYRNSLSMFRRLLLIRWVAAGARLVSIGVR
jgi:hypothetical protein